MSHSERVSRCLPVGLLLVAVAVAVPILRPARRDGPTVYRSSWCPRPEDRAMPGPSLTPDRLIARLREIRARHARYAATRPTGDPDGIEEVDALLLELISDIQIAATPLEEPRP